MVNGIQFGPGDSEKGGGEWLGLWMIEASAIEIRKSEGQNLEGKGV